MRIDNRAFLFPPFLTLHGRCPNLPQLVYAFVVVVLSCKVKDIKLGGYANRIRADIRGASAPLARC